jgi:hypothetical protein
LRAGLHAARWAAECAMRDGPRSGGQTLVKGKASSSFFEKKEPKKLLLLRAVPVKPPQTQNNKSFLLLFSKKEVFFRTIVLRFTDFPALAFSMVAAFSSAVRLA